MTGCGKSSPPELAVKEPPPASVETVASSLHPMDTVIMAKGTLAPAQGASVRMAPIVAGRLIDIRVR
jgi:hypothetical protein